jgi:hypothetical protein
VSRPTQGSHVGCHIRGYHPLRPAFPDRSATQRKTTGLFRFRSPLLTESLLMSVPPGTEMFQFPGFASPHYVFMWRYPIGVGCPIRISTDQRLLAAPHGFSQRATSFIASWCQGIHRMPLSRSRSQHPPRGGCRNPPCTGTIHTQTSNRMQIPPPHGQATHSAQRNPIEPVRWNPVGTPSNLSDGTPSHTPLNASAMVAGQPPHESHPVRLATTARPETHQNLIHPDKEPASPNRETPRNPKPGAPKRRPRPDPGNDHAGPPPQGARTPHHRNSIFSATTPDRNLNTNGDQQACLRGDQQAGSVVEVIGFEPTTPCLQSRCSPS